LPASGKPVEDSRADSNIVRGQGKILVLEDDEVVIRVCKELLNMLGYEADIVETGEEAIRKYEIAMKSPSPYDMVILDLTIRGGMGGKETITKLKTIDPNVIGIVSSGYSEDPIVANFQQYGFMARLTKPYNIEEMSKTLHKML
jgi:two-component system cell cycle sensor histidine kinase/response regulator CckA